MRAFLPAVNCFVMKSDTRKRLTAWSGPGKYRAIFRTRASEAEPWRHVAQGESTTLTR